MNEQNLRRAVALVIDFFLISIVYSILINFVPGMTLDQQVVGIQLSLELGPDWFLLITMGYFIGCDLLNQGESLGKDIMGLHTISPEDEVLDVPVRLFRTLLKGISLLALPIAILAFFWQERGLTLQDYLTGSTVCMRPGFKPMI